MSVGRYSAGKATVEITGKWGFSLDSLSVGANRTTNNDYTLMLQPGRDHHNPHRV